jgi:HPt (histidine-containing phosphotransfer) domain-containing protein
MGPERARSIQLRKNDPRLRAGDPASLLIDTSEPIDRVHLGRYSLGSLSLEREILGLFLAQLPLSIEQLRFAVTDREWQIAAHTIKGSARAVGAWQVARLALEAEQTSGVADEEEREKFLAALDEACETIEAYVDEEFPPEPPRA